MLTREIMGMLGLGIVWVAAILVALAAMQDLGDVLGRRRRAKRVVKGVVQSGDGDDGAFAEWRVEQRGRALDAAQPRIGFHDKSFRSSLTGGVVRAGEQTVRLAGPGELWVDGATRARAAICTNAETFDVAYARATDAAGFHRTIGLTLRAGDDVFVLGALDGECFDFASGSPCVATFDPRAELTRHAFSIVGFVVAELLACAGSTWLAASGPHFGVRSVVGALLCLAFYLGVTPLAVALRERVRPPNEAYVRGTWSLSGAARASGPAREA
jgi:hypothetical protein